MKPATLEDLQADSARYLDRLEQEQRLGQPRPRVCHHFFPLDVAGEDVYIPDLPNRLKLLDEEAQVDVIGDPVGLEVWFLREPNKDWLDPLVCKYHQAAVACSAVYGGWSYEPDDRAETTFAGMTK